MWHPGAMTTGDGGDALARARADFIEGVVDGDAEGGRRWPSMSEAARRHDLEPDWVRRKAKQQGWGDERDRFQATVERKARLAKARHLAEQVASIEERSLQAASMGLDTVLSRLEEITQTTSAAPSPEGGGIDEPPEVVDLLDSRELDALAKAARRFRDLGIEAATGGAEHERAEAERSLTTGGEDAEDASTPVAARLAEDTSSERVHGIASAMARSGILDEFLSAASSADDEEDDEGAEGAA